MRSPGMLERIIQSCFSAIIGALAALAVVFHSGDTGSKFDELEVENLTVTEKMVLRHPETDKDSVVIEAGSVMAANKVVSTQFLASQVAASVIVGNKLLTTPDNIAETPVYDWRFFTELNSDPGCGGELLIRSPRGWNGVGKTLDEGSVVRIGYDSHDNAQIFTFNQATKDAVPVAMERPRWRR
ncbi:MAG TPA: hypothetical protein DEB39_08050, partial [Planctomycetaceae bacterium]|nr:hypothetical protein [Planctomycetaceae bacterium]